MRRIWTVPEFFLRKFLYSNSSQENSSRVRLKTWKRENVKTENVEKTNGNKRKRDSHTNPELRKLRMATLEPQAPEGHSPATVRLENRGSPPVVLRHRGTLLLPPPAWEPPSLINKSQQLKISA